MLEIYLSSVIIWMIIIYSTVKICKLKLYENGWGNTATDVKQSKLISLFVLSAVPILRIIVVCGVIYMTTITKDDFEKVQKERKNNE